MSWLSVRKSRNDFKLSNMTSKSVYRKDLMCNWQSILCCNNHYHCTSGFTTLTYLRVHAQKHHGQEWKDSSMGRGSGPGGVLLCQLCGVHCKTPTQLQGHMATHANQADPTVPDPISSSSTLAGTVSTATPVSSPAATVGLLVTDCSSIAAQSHS